MHFFTEQNILLFRKETRKSFVSRSCSGYGQCTSGCWDRDVLPAGHDPAKSPSAPQCLHHRAKHSSEITASSGCSEKILPRIFCHCALYLEPKEHLNRSRLMIVALKSPLWLPVEMNAFDVRALQRSAVSS